VTKREKEENFHSKKEEEKLSRVSSEMKTSALILIFPLLVFRVNTLNQTDEHRQQQWEDFKIKFKRSYNESEEAKRFNIFERNCDQIQKHNDLFFKGKETFRLGINRYSDMIFETEIVALHTPKNGTQLDGLVSGNYLEILLIDFKFHFCSYYIPDNYHEAEILQFDENFEAPPSFDWREKGAVSSIKDQLPCGSW
jgi:C1A family cysteine protease